MRGIIYKATNKLNNKIYIGQTYRSNNLTSEKLLINRKNKHLKEALNKKTNWPFHNALRKYGENSFNWEVVLCCNCRNTLNKYETHFINRYNSLIDNEGYNATKGGSLNKYSELSKKKQSDSAKKRWKREGKKITEAQLSGKKNSKDWLCKAQEHAQQYLHSPESRIKASKSIKETWNKIEYKNLKSKQSLEYWCNKSAKEKETLLNKGIHSKEARKKTALKNSKSVILIDNMSKKELGIFCSAVELARHLNIKPGNIRAVLSKRNKSKSFCKGKYTVQFLNTTS